MTLKFVKLVTYDDRKLPIESHDPLTTQSCEVTRKI